MKYDTKSHEKFVEYYSKASQSQETWVRLRSIRDTIVNFIHDGKGGNECLRVADIGCGAGTQCLVWAEYGHKVYGIDINKKLVQIARSRAFEKKANIGFCVGSASELPWDDRTMDVCLVLELLEHVGNWNSCLNEFDRILKPGGILFLTTTNNLCPSQQEFSLPVYSWYPSFVKRRIERLSLSKYPQWVNYARYPAVNWFNYFLLKKELSSHGYSSYDRFDVMDLTKRNAIARLIVGYIRKFSLLRLLAHVATPGTIVLAVKK